MDRDFSRWAPLLVFGGIWSRCSASSASPRTRPPYTCATVHVSCRRNTPRDAHAPDQRLLLQPCRGASRSSSRGGQARAAATAADCHPMVNANYVVFPKDSSCGSSAAGFKRVVRSPTTHTFGLCRRKLLPRRGLLRSLTRGCKRFCLSYRCSRRLVVRGLRTVCAAAEFRCLCSRRGPPHHYELGLVVYPRLPAPLCGRASTAGRSCGLVLWPFVARSMPPPWCSSLVRSCLYVLSTLVLCVCLLCSAHALACQTQPWAVLLLWHSLYCQ